MCFTTRGLQRNSGSKPLDATRVNVRVILRQSPHRDGKSDVRDSRTQCTTPRQRGQLTLLFQNNVFPSFSHLLQPGAVLDNVSLLPPRFYPRA
jgi:hypothetical protein